MPLGFGVEREEGGRLSDGIGDPQRAPLLEEPVGGGSGGREEDLFTKSCMLSDDKSLFDGDDIWQAI